VNFLGACRRRAHAAQPRALIAPVLRDAAPPRVRAWSCLLTCRKRRAHAPAPRMHSACMRCCLMPGRIYPRIWRRWRLPCTLHGVLTTSKVHSGGRQVWHAAGRVLRRALLPIMLHGAATCDPVIGTHDPPTTNTQRSPRTRAAAVGTSRGSCVRQGRSITLAGTPVICCRHSLTRAAAAAPSSAHKQGPGAEAPHLPAWGRAATRSQPCARRQHSQGLRRACWCNRCAAHPQAVTRHPVLQRRNTQSPDTPHPGAPPGLGVCAAAVSQVSVCLVAW
jgi:hypothetical protein